MIGGIIDERLCKYSKWISHGNRVYLLKHLGPPNIRFLFIYLAIIVTQRYLEMFPGHRLCALLLCALIALPACDRSPERAAQHGTDRHVSEIKKLDTKYLPNTVQIHSKVITGGLPADDDAFKELADLGVKTIISVDGAKPDVVAAQKHGLRYVHLPHGYDGVSNERAKELAKAVNELDGPIYIHCHHGKHRSPTAGAVACVGAGLISHEQSREILELAGTSGDYAGLFKSTEDAREFEKSLLADLDTEFLPIVQVPPMAQAMVDLEKSFHHLQLLAMNQWRPMTDHPDIIPAHEALILREHFTELQRTSESKSYGNQFLDWLQSSESSAMEIQNHLKSIEQLGDTQRAQTVKLIDNNLMSIKTDCSACHNAFRNKALQNK